MNFVASDIKELNRRAVYALVRSRGEISKAELSRLSGISAPTVMKIVDCLMDAGFVEEAGEGSSSLGRKPHLLRYVPEAAYSVGAEFDGLAFVIGLVDLAGNIGPLRRLEGGADLRSFLRDRLASEVEALVSDSGVDPSRIKGLGLGLPGVVGPSPKTLWYAPLVGVDDLLDLEPYVRDLEARLGLPIALENDANAAALGEHAARGLGDGGDLLYVEAGRGLGAGIVLDGKLRRGPGAFAGELGYLVMEGDHRASIDKPGWLESMVDLPRVWAEAARGPVSQGSLERILPLLALALTNICVSVDIGTVVVGTGAVSIFGEAFVGELEALMRRYSVVGVRCELPVSPEPGVAGAASLAMEKWLDEVFAG